MRTRAKFISELFGFSLKNIKKLEAQFDPFHPNAPNVREFWAGVTDKKALKTNPECVVKTQIVSDRSDPLITIQFKDNHRLVLNGKHMESGHFIQLIRQFETIHKHESEDV